MAPGAARETFLFPRNSWAAFMNATPPHRSSLFSGIVLFLLLVLFCFPGGAVLAELTRLRSTVEVSFTIEMIVAVLCTIIVAYCLVSRWTPLRSAGCGLALIGYAGVANLLVPGQAIAWQLTWLAVGGVLGVAAGAWLAPRKRSQPASRAGVEPGARGPAAESEPPPRRSPVRVRRLVVLGGAVACVLLLLLLHDRSRVAAQARIAEAVGRCEGLAVFDDHPTPLLVFDRLAHLAPDATEREWTSLSCIELGPSASDGELEELLALGLNDLPDLNQLSLRRSQVTDAGLVGVEPMVRLQRLALGPATTDAGLVHVQRLVGLQCLDLSGTRITGKGLRLSKDLPGLYALNLSRTGVTDDDLACLKDFSSLCYLHLCDTPITDAGLVHLKDLGELRFLALIGTRISDAGLVHLKDVPQLRWVLLEGTAVTAAGRSDLAQSRPGLIVFPLTGAGPSAAKTRPAKPRR